MENDNFELLSFYETPVSTTRKCTVVGNSRGHTVRCTPYGTFLLTNERIIELPKGGLFKCPFAATFITKFPPEKQPPAPKCKISRFIDSDWSQEPNNYPVLESYLR